MPIKGYVVTGQIKDDGKVIAVRLCSLDSFEPLIINKCRLGKFCRENNVLNVRYSNGRLISLSELLPVKFLRVFNGSGEVTFGGVYSESELLSAYTGLDSEEVFARVCHNLVFSDNIQEVMNACIYYEELRHRSGDIDKIAGRIKLPITDILGIKNYLFNNLHTIGNEVFFFRPSIKIAQSWERLTDSEMDIDEQDILLVKSLLLEKEYTDGGMDYVTAHELVIEEYGLEFAG